MKIDAGPKVKTARTWLCFQRPCALVVSADVRVTMEITWVTRKCPAVRFALYNVELMMAYNFRSVGKVSFVIRVSVRFNGVSVRVMKQGIVPSKLLIAASEITVFLGSNITDVTPFCSPSEEHGQRPRKR